MKVVMLVEDSVSEFGEMEDILKGRKTLFVNTENCDEAEEYAFLSDSITYFTQSDNEIMLAKFSGRESIVNNLGGEHSEMIVTLSYNKNSKYYNEKPKTVFLDLIEIFDKETI